MSAKGEGRARVGVWSTGYGDIITRRRQIFGSNCMWIDRSPARLLQREEAAVRVIT